MLNCWLILVSQSVTAEPPKIGDPVSGLDIQIQDLANIINIPVQIKSMERLRSANAPLIPGDGYTSNWWMKAGWDNYGKMPDIMIPHNYVQINENVGIRKINWSKLAWEFAEPYSACMELDFLLQDYQDMLHSKLSTISYQLLEKARDQSNNGDSYSWMWLSRTLAFISAGKIGPGVIRLNPNIVPNHYGLNCSYRIGFGLINYSWDMERDRYSIKVRIPLYQVHLQDK